MYFEASRLRYPQPYQSSLMTHSGAAEVQWRGIVAERDNRKILRFQNLRRVQKQLTELHFQTRI